MAAPRAESVAKPAPEGPCDDSPTDGGPIYKQGARLLQGFAVSKNRTQ